jgi:hypothetical protein
MASRTLWTSPWEAPPTPTTMGFPMNVKRNRPSRGPLRASPESRSRRGWRHLPAWARVAWNLNKEGEEARDQPLRRPLNPPNTTHSS